MSERDRRNSSGRDSGRNPSERTVPVKKKKRKITDRDIARMEAKVGMPMYKKNPDKYAKKLPPALNVLVKVLSVFLNIFLVCGVVGIIVLGLAVTVIYAYTEPELIDKFEDQDINMSSVIYVLDENGDYVEYETLYSSEHRMWANSEEICDNIKNAAVAIEDKRFYVHMGVDPITTGKATLNYAIAKLTHKNTAGLAGGSTITQQLIKNVSGDEDQSPARKIKEMFRAMYLERNYSKEQILEFYLNTVYFGNNQYGVGTASQYYYGKEPSELSVVEAAGLVCITKSPYYFEPYSHADNNRERRNQVLWEMCDQKMITKEEYDEYIKEDLVLRDRSVESEKETDEDWSYATDMIFEEVVEDLMAEYGYTRNEAVSKMYTGGLKIYSTIQLDVQNIMEDYFSNPENLGTEKYYNEKKDEYEYPEVAMLVMDPYTGDVVGVIGGRGEKTGKLGLNRATQSLRQPGSSIKPLTVYGQALEKDIITLGTAVDDYPVSFSGKPWPSNFDSRYRGLMSVTTAITFSYNCPAVRVLQMQQDGPGDFTSVYKFAKETLHLENLTDTDNAAAPLSLGALTHGLTVEEMTRAYTVFANKGKYTDSRSYSKVESYSGKTILQKDVNSVQVFSEQTSFLMTDVLQNVMKYGFATSAKVPGIATAGKTGTTSSYYDRWFVGYTPYYLGGIWWGYDNNHSLSSKFASQTRIWGEVMELIHQKKNIKSGTFEKPAGIVSASYCIDSGMSPSALCSSDSRGRIRTAYFKDGTQPRATCKLHHSLPVCSVSNKLAHTGCPTAYYKTFVNWRHEFGNRVNVEDAPFLCPRVTEDTNIVAHNGVASTCGACKIHAATNGLLWNGGGSTVDPTPPPSTDGGGSTNPSLPTLPPTPPVDPTKPTGDESEPSNME